MTSFNPDRNELLDTYKELGTVIEAFRLNHRAKFEAIMEGMRRPGRHRPRPLRHLRRRRPQLRPAVRARARLQVEVVRLRLQRPARQLQRTAATSCSTKGDYHLTRDTDTEIIMHYLSLRAAGRGPGPTGRASSAGSPRSSTAPTTSSSSTPWATWSSPATRWASGRSASPRTARCSPRPARACRCRTSASGTSARSSRASWSSNQDGVRIERFAAVAAGRRTASSSGSTSPTSPARSTTAAST